MEDKQCLCYGISLQGHVSRENFFYYAGACCSSLSVYFYLNCIHYMLLNGRIIINSKLEVYGGGEANGSPAYLNRLKKPIKNPWHDCQFPHKDLNSDLPNDGEGLLSKLKLQVDIPMQASSLILVYALYCTTLIRTELQICKGIHVYAPRMFIRIS
jgi:hypothetical protein